MRRVKTLLKCVIIISMFWGFTVGGPLSCGSGAGGSGCACAPSEEGELPPVFQYVVDLIKAIIYAIAPQIESGGKYIKQTFVGPKCGNIIDTTKLEYAGIDFTEPIEPSTFTIAGNISVEQIDYWSRVPVTFPVLSFDSAQFQSSNTRLVLMINRATIRPDTIYTITFTSPVANPVKTAKGESITTKIYKPPSQGGGLDHEEDFTLPWTFTVRVPDGVLPYITNFGAAGVDLSKVPPHSEVLPTATFSEPMSMVAVMYEMFTGSGWVTCPCDPALNPVCNECAGAGPLGLYRTYRNTYLSSGTYCSYATRDLSGEPLTAWPGSNIPGDVSYTYTTSKVRIEEPVAKPGEVKEYNINPIRIAGKTTQDINTVTLSYLDPFTDSTFSSNLISQNGSFSKDLYLSRASNDISYRIEAQAITSGGGNGGKDFVDVIMKPQPRIAKMTLPVWGLRFACECNLDNEEACKNGESPYNECPLLSGIAIPGNTVVWIPKAYYNDFAAIIFGVGIATGNPLLIIGAGLLALLNYIFDFKLEIARVEIDESHLILDEMEITPKSSGIHFYLNYRLWINSGEVIYFGGLYRYPLGGRTLFGGLKINYNLDFGFNETTCQWALPGCLARGLSVSTTQFDVSLDWFDLPGATSGQNNKARDEIVNRIRANFLEEVDENGMTGAQRLAKAFKYLLLTSFQTEIYYWDNNHNLATYSSTSRTCTDECYNRCYNDCITNQKAVDCGLYCNPTIKQSYGLADVYSDNTDYNWRIQIGDSMSEWEKWFNSGTLRGRRCDEYTNSAPGLGLSPLIYIPQQAHYPNPDLIPFAWGFEQSQYWQWPSTDKRFRWPIEIEDTKVAGRTSNIYIYLNYFDCIFF